jgi:AcrR family transcriptional regulator
MSDAARRELILKAADRLLRHYGQQKTTVADIAREAGVGTGTVYLEFDSKEAIVEELSRGRHHAMLDAMRAAATAPGRPCRDRLSGALDARLAAFFALADEGTHACDLVHCASSAVKTAQATFYEAEIALLADVLREGARTGEFDVADPARVARAVLRAYASFKPPWVFAADRRETQQAMAAVHDLVLHGLLARPGPGGKKRRA